MNNTEQINKIRADFVEKSNKAKVENYKAHVIDSLSDKEKEAIKLIAGLSDTVGGPTELNRLVSAFNFINNAE